MTTIYFKQFEQIASNINYNFIDDNSKSYVDKTIQCI